MIHWNTKYLSLLDASTQRDGLAVIAILFNVTDHFTKDLHFEKLEVIF